MNLETILKELPILEKVLVKYGVLPRIPSDTTPVLEYDEHNRNLIAKANDLTGTFDIDPIMDGVDISKYLKQDIATYNHELGILRARVRIQDSSEEEKRSREALSHMAHFAGEYEGRKILLCGELKLDTTDIAIKSTIGCLVYRAACAGERDKLSREEQRLLLDNIDFSEYFIRPPVWQEEALAVLIETTKQAIHRHGYESLLFHGKQLATVGYGDVSRKASDLLVRLIEFADHSR